MEKINLKKKKKVVARKFLYSMQYGLAPILAWLHFLEAVMTKMGEGANPESFNDYLLVWIEISNLARAPEPV